MDSVVRCRLPIQKELPAAARCEFLTALRIEHNSRHRTVFIGNCNGYAPLWVAIQKIDRSVQGVHDPSVPRRADDLLPLLAEDAIVRTEVAENRTDGPLTGFVRLRYGVCK
jgi:hypothetical protein